MKLYIILGLGLLAGLGLYLHQANQPPPIEKFEPLPPPPPPPPPPTLAPEELRKSAAELEDQNSTVRVAALNKLAKFYNPEIDSMLARRLRSDFDPEVRSLAVDLLASRHRKGPDGEEDARNTAMIAEGLRDTDTQVRLHVIQTIGSLNGRSAVNALTQHLFDTEVDIRRAIVSTLNAMANFETSRLEDTSYTLPLEFQKIYEKALAHAHRTDGRN